MTAIDFVRIDRDILTRKDLSDKGKMLLGLITTFNSQGLTLGNEELAEILCVHENSVGRLLADLERKGFVRITNRQSKFRRVYSNTSAGVETDSTPTPALPTPTPARVYSNTSAAHSNTSVGHNRRNRKNRSNRSEEAPNLTLRTFVGYWNAKGNLPKVRGLTDRREEHFGARLKEPLFVENWKEIIDKAAASVFLTTKCKPFDLSWILKNSDNYVKILEGKYDNRPDGGQPPTGGTAESDRDYYTRCDAAIDAMFPIPTWAELEKRMGSAWRGPSTADKDVNG